ncbi:D123-domain-containing protein [Naematelia encephala]|uniref:D123-domain-containing protein n=1 Tax=Naematelia encephala TaxID=71784 RepID=A0A1Y2AQJ3_9TREE|nr:D123-domain-containing protein [Naematelia encephala]
MPVPIPPPAPIDIYPQLSRDLVEEARTSAWYPAFSRLSLPSTFIDIDQLGEREAFLEWLDGDSIFLPQDSESPPVTSSSNRQRAASISSLDSAGSSSGSSSSSAPIYHLPRINEAIRAAISRYGAVFPKLNWTSPKDVAFILPQTAHGPLHCTSPADVYLLLKTSDFVPHGLEVASAFAECDEAPGQNHLKIELVLKKHVDINPAREFRCFVRSNTLIAITQRDPNYYEHLQGAQVQESICNTVRAFWEDEIWDVYAGGPDYVFDLYLSSDHASALILDFQPYRQSTDPLLFTYSELRDILEESRNGSDDRPRLPILRVIDSASHPQASRNAPAYGSSMMPMEMMELSQGRSMAEFASAWQSSIGEAMEE